MEQVSKRLDNYTPRQVIDLIAGLAIIAVVFLAMSRFLTAYAWDFWDWTLIYHKIGQAPLNPYEAAERIKFANPPWLAWILIPFSALPPLMGLSAWMTFTILATIWCVKKLGGGIFVVLLTLLSPAFYRLFVHGQIDIISLLGFVFMITFSNMNLKSLGVILMLVKPQVLGLSIPVHWLGLERNEKAAIVIRIGAFFLLTLLVNGLWYSPMWRNIQRLGVGTNISVWPYGIPVGVILVALAIWKKNDRLAGLATIFLVPYFNSSSLFPYTVVLFASIPRLWATVVFVLLWLLAILSS